MSELNFEKVPCSFYVEVIGYSRWQQSWNNSREYKIKFVVLIYDHDSMR